MWVVVSLVRVSVASATVHIPVCMMESHATTVSYWCCYLLTEADLWPLSLVVVGCKDDPCQGHGTCNHPTNVMDMYECQCNNFNVKGKDCTGTTYSTNFKGHIKKKSIKFSCNMYAEGNVTSSIAHVTTQVWITLALWPAFMHAQYCELWWSVPTFECLTYRTHLAQGIYMYCVWSSFHISVCMWSI